MTDNELHALEMAAVKKTGGRYYLSAEATKGEITCKVRPHGRGTSGKGYQAEFYLQGKKIARNQLIS
jgi:hypothetical protein